MAKRSSETGDMDQGQNQLPLVVRASNVDDTIANIELTNMTITDNTGDMSSHLPEIAEKNSLKSRAFRHSSTISQPQYSADLV